MTTPGTNWQIMLADLSIILFLMTFSALAHDDGLKPKPRAAPAVISAPAVAEPVAAWRAGQGAPPLGEWLKSQAADARMRINVHAAYSAGRREQLLSEAAAVGADPALAGRAVRLILEPGAADAVTVTLTYDQG